MRLHYTTIGDQQKDPLVLVHGLFGNGNNLMALARKLATHYHVILPDQRNHGKSPWHEHMNYPAMADDIAAMLNLMHIDRVLLVGHSMGGKTAMKFALRYPHRVSKLVALDIAPVTYTSTRNTELIGVMQRIDLGKIKTMKQAKEELQIEDEATKMFLLQNIVRSDAGFTWRINLDALGNAMPDIAAFPRHTKSTGTPTLFVHGTNSDYLLPEHHASINTIFPENSVVPLPGASHWLHSERPGETASAIMEFVAQA